MCNGNYKGTEIFKMAVVIIGLFKELELDHVSIAAVGVERWVGRRIKMGQIINKCTGKNMLLQSVHKSDAHWIPTILTN